MPLAFTKEALHPNKKRLLELMQRINFGCIEGLVIREGNPVFRPSPQVIKEVKFGAENGPRPEVAKTDFELKKETLDLFIWLDSLRNGTIHTLEVKHGLPFKMILKEVAV